jgi:hypothetical protein
MDSEIVNFNIYISEEYQTITIYNFNPIDKGKYDSHLMALINRCDANLVCETDKCHVYKLIDFKKQLNILINELEELGFSYNLINK